MREYSYLLHFPDQNSNDLLTAAITTPLQPSEDAFQPLQMIGIEWYNRNEDGSAALITEVPYFVFGYCREDRTSFSNFGAIVFPENEAFLISEATFIYGKILSMSYPRAAVDGEEVDIPGYHNVADEDVELHQLNIEISAKNAEIISNAIARLNVIVCAELYSDDSNFIKIRRNRSITLRGFEPWNENIWLKNWDISEVSLRNLSSFWRARLHFE